MPDKRCFNCKFFMTEDQGYSNYTVLETIASCLKNGNPALPCEESYSWRRENANCAEMMVAEQCPHYKEGDGIVFDVDGEVTISDYANDQELLEAYNAYVPPKE